MMTLDEQIFDKIDQYILALMKECSIREVYIFGSSVSGQDLQGSDIDIAIVSEDFNAANVIDYMTRFILLSSGYALNIEPHLFNPEDSSDDFFKREIVEKGIKILPTAA